MTAAPSRRTLRATVHPSVLSRIPRFFDSSLPTTATELLQNARRAGAGAVTVHVDALPPPRRKPDHHAFRITVRDDGCGVANPSILVSFGNSGWDAATIAAEDAAGMGLACLAHTTVAVRSATRPGDGFAVTLRPAHFAGDLAATLRPDPDMPTGTSIAFETVVNPAATACARIRNGSATAPAQAALDTIVRAFADAARHYPVPVTLETPDGTRPIVQESFLHDAFEVPEDDVDAGVAFAVRRSHASVSHDFNVFGLRLKLDLPSIIDLDGRCWTVLADVRTSPGIRLTLPARQGAADDAALAAFRARAERALYQGIRTATDALPPGRAPILPAPHWARARDLGVELPAAPAELPPATGVHIDSYGEHRIPRPKPLPDHAIAIDRDRLFPTLLDALQSRVSGPAADVARRLVLRNPKLADYRWHADLPEVDAVDVILRQGAVTFRHPVTGPDALPEDAEPPFGDLRPDLIRYVLRLRHPDGRRTTRTISAGIHLHPELEIHDPGEIPLVVVAGEPPAPWHVATLAAATYFAPSDDCESDSHDTQRNRFLDEATTAACHFLLPAGEAIASVLHERVRQELVWDVPRGSTATIRIHRPAPADDAAPAPADVRVSVEVDGAVAELAS